MHPRTPSFVPEEARAAVVLPVAGSFGGTVHLPGSKSLTNRALLLAALASGESTLENALDCDDSRYMIDGLNALGAETTITETGGRQDTVAFRGPRTRRVTEAANVTVRGVGGPFPVKRGELYLGNAGTTTRFLTAALATSEGEYTVDGDERMRARPIEDLVRALNLLGARVRARSGCPPVEIQPARLSGGRIGMSGRISSQFVSAVLMAAPLATRAVAVRLEGEPVSRPYLELTLQCMRDFGAKVLVYDKTRDGQPVFEVVPGRPYRPRRCTVEGDASAASYFYAAAAITGSTIRVEGVGRESVQGDLRAADVLAEMGCRVNKEANAVTVTGGFLRSADCDCSDIPDVVPTLAVVALFARGRTRLRGVPHLRHKESDRIAAVATELRKLGADVKELRDGLEIIGTLGPRATELRGAEIDTWSDHRIAMALAVAGLVVPGVMIRDPRVIGKSYPSFFQALASLGTGVEFVLENGERRSVGLEVGS